MTGFDAVEAKRMIAQARETVSDNEESYVIEVLEAVTDHLELAVAEVTRLNGEIEALFYAAHGQWRGGSCRADLDAAMRRLSSDNGYFRMPLTPSSTEPESAPSK